MIKKITSYVAAAIVSCSVSFAQTTTKKIPHGDIFKELNTKTEGSGKVTLHQNSKLNLLVNRKIKEAETKTNITFSGYRIQAYMDNNQKKSKDEAYAREKKLKEKYEGLTTYISFSSPFWKLRVGDFRTHADALVMAKKIKDDFPELVTELLIVKDDEVRDVTLEPNTESAQTSPKKK